MATKKITPMNQNINYIIPEHVDEIYLRTTQVCKMFNISLSQIKKLRANGTIPCYKLGKTYLYNPEEIIAALQRVTPKN